MFRPDLRVPPQTIDILSLKLGAKKFFPGKNNLHFWLQLKSNHYFFCR